MLLVLVGADVGCCCPVLLLLRAGVTPPVDITSAASDPFSFAFG